jgi:hypothetical protein
VVGSVGKLGNTWSMVVRLVSVQTGEILASAQDSREGQIDVLLRESVPTLASQLLGLGPKAAPAAVAAPTVDRARSRQQQNELLSILSNKAYLEKKGMARAQVLSDSVDLYVRHSLYAQNSTSGWWAFGNYPVIPVGSIVQGDWRGIGYLGLGYLAALVVASRDGENGKALVGATYIYGLIRPIWYANATNKALKSALQVVAYPSLDGQGAAAKLAYQF